MSEEIWFEKQVLIFKIKKSIFCMQNPLKKNFEKFFIHFVPSSSISVCYKNQVHMTCRGSKIPDTKYFVYFTPWFILPPSS